MRDPRVLLAELGPLPFAVAQVTMAGMVVSALLHPLFVGTFAALVAKLVLEGVVTVQQSVLLGLDVLNVALAYSAYLWLGWRTLGPDEQRGFGRIVLWTPIYWLMMSFAAWRGVLQLIRRPHHWEKTPHPRRRLAT